jgi:hypothetical protein
MVLWVLGLLDMSFYVLFSLRAGRKLVLQVGRACSAGRLTPGRRRQAPTVAGFYCACLSGIALQILVLATGGTVSVVASPPWQVCVPIFRRATDSPTPQVALLLVLFSLNRASMAWGLGANARQMLNESIAAVQFEASKQSDKRTSRQRADSTVRFVSLALYLITAATVVAVGTGHLVLPLVLADLDSKQQSLDASFIIFGVLLSTIHLTMAIAYRRLAAIVRAQVRVHRDMFQQMSSNSVLVDALSNLSTRMRRVSLLMTSYVPVTLVFFIVLGSYTGSRWKA